MNRIEGQTVLVTGASSGIGEGGSEVLTFGLDVRERSAVEAFCDDVSSAGAMPDVLVNNAGKALGLDPLQEGDPDDWDEMIDTNVKGLRYMSRAFVPHMIEQDRGHVVMMPTDQRHSMMIHRRGG